MRCMMYVCYSARNKNEVFDQLQEKKKLIIRRFSDGNSPVEEETYHAHYRGLDDLPIAFADIEMVFNDERRTVDWIFRYGNQALAFFRKGAFGSADRQYVQQSVPQYG